MRALIFSTSLLIAAANACATDIQVLGLMQDKAMLVVDGGEPRMYAAGATLDGGAKLVAVTSAGATIEQNGRREILSMGQYAGSGNSARRSVTLHAEGGGHFYVDGKINGLGARMMVDTGASWIAMSASDAIRFGIDYRRGVPSVANTANGNTRIYMVKLQSARVGDIEIPGVEAVVQESGLDVILLGNSFLNRVTMRREGQEMTLTAR